VNETGGISLDYVLRVGALNLSKKFYGVAHRYSSSGSDDCGQRHVQFEARKGCADTEMDACPERLLEHDFRESHVAPEY
jgi:hypothetical protein